MCVIRGMHVVCGMKHAAVLMISDAPASEFENGKRATIDTIEKKPCAFVSWVKKHDVYNSKICVGNIQV